MNLKTAALVLAGALAALPTFGMELQRAEGSAISIKTNTEFGVDLDHPQRYGLNFSIPELAITLDLFGYQHLTNKIKSSKPIGFVDFTLGLTQIRFTNNGQADYNSPHTSGKAGDGIGLGFNDSAGGDTGYFGPLYLQNFRSGILWGDWILQLGAGGTDSFWDPWHREAVGYGSLSASWAYLDTRVQYQRGLIPTLVKDRLDNPDKRPSETGYWDYDKQSGVVSQGIDTLNTSFGGTMIGLQYAGANVEAMAKVATKRSWTEASSSSNPNGLAGGLDLNFHPTNLKGLRVFTSVASGILQGGAQPNLVLGGAKVGYDLKMGKNPLKIQSIEPSVGLDVSKAFELGTTGANGAPAAEVSAALTFHTPGTNGWGWDYLAGETGRTGNVYSGVTLAYRTALDDLTDPVLHHAAQVTWYLDPDGGVIKNSASELVAKWTNIGETEHQLEVTGYVDTKIPGFFGGNLVPWTKVYVDYFRTAAMTESMVNAKVDLGFKVTKAIRNAEFDLSYLSRNLTASPTSKDLDFGYGALGVVKFGVQVNL